MKTIVSIMMGSRSDLEAMTKASDVLDEFGVECETKIISAHRAPKLMIEYVEDAEKRGVQIFIAGAGMAAHLPGMVAAITSRPVIGVPLSSKHLEGLDALLSIVQMPKGVPVACVAIDNATNAALLAVRILSLKDPSLHKKLLSFNEKQTLSVVSGSIG